MATHNEEVTFGHLAELSEDDGLPPIILGGSIDINRLIREAETAGRNVTLHDLSEFAINHSDVA